MAERRRRAQRVLKRKNLVQAAAARSICPPLSASPCSRSRNCRALPLRALDGVDTRRRRQATVQSGLGASGARQARGALGASGAPVRLVRSTCGNPETYYDCQQQGWADPLLDADAEKSEFDVDPCIRDRQQDRGGQQDDGGVEDFGDHKEGLTMASTIGGSRSGGGGAAM